MRLTLSSFILSFLLLSNAAHAGEPEIDIRPVEQSSTDVFDVLTQMLGAEQAYAEADYAVALEKYRYVYLHDPAQEQAKLGYANSALAIGQVNLADRLFKSMSSDAARNGQVLCAVIKSTTDYPEQALRGRLKITPEDSRLWNALGRVLDGDGRGSEARQAYAMAGMAGQRPGLTENNLGQSFLMEGNWSAAHNHFTRAALQAPSNARFDNNRRLVMMLKGDYSKAISGVTSERASQLLADAGVIAAQKDELRLAKTLFETAQTLRLTYDQSLDMRIARIERRLQTQI